MEQRDLAFVALSDDGRRLVLASHEGQEFTLAVDAPLAVALRGATSRTAPLEKPMESILRPRDIQARIRAGESPETVAAAAQTSLDKVMAYATPVLAERAHVAERAQRASARRRGGDGPARVLGEAVAEQLRTAGTDPDTAAWDAWRRDDGRWTVTAQVTAGGRPRTGVFTFDAPGRFVVPEDDDARWLLGDVPAPTATPGQGRRLSAVRTEEELPLGEDALGLVADPAPTTNAGTRAPGSGVAEGPGDTDVEEKPDDVDTVTAPLFDPLPGTEGRPAEPSRDPAPGATGATGPDDAAETSEAVDAPYPDEPDEGAAGETGPAAKRPARKNRGRASVPSWDEIMFGGGNRE